MQEERRRFKRYKIPEVTGSLLFTYQAELVNVSLTGLALEGLHELGADRSYRVSLELDEQRLDLEGRVVWSERADSGKYRAGMQFRDVWTPDALQLLKLIQTKVLADLDTRLVRRFQSQKPGSVHLSADVDFLVKCISLSGVEVESEHSLPVGEIYDMEVSLREERAVLQGRVCNVRRDNPRTNPLFLIGIEFEDLTEEGEGLLEAFIERELAPG